MLFAPSQPTTNACVHAWRRRPARTTTWSPRSSTAVTSTPRRSPISASVGHPAFQERLEFGLAEHRRCRPPGGTVAAPAEAQQRVAARVAPFVEVGGFADRPEIVADAARLEEPADLVVEVDGAGQRVRLGPPFEHASRCDHAGRAGSRASDPSARRRRRRRRFAAAIVVPSDVMPPSGAGGPMPRSGRSGGCRPIRRRSTRAPWPTSTWNPAGLCT